MTALIAFSLGYVVRGIVERASNVSNSPEELALREDTESPTTEAQTIVGADQNDAEAPFVASSNHEVVVKGDRSSSRKYHMKDRLGDFFVINDIGAERKEQIINGLIDADTYIAQKRQSMINRHLADQAGPISQEEIDTMRLTAEEATELYSEQESLYRQIIDEYYEAYREYERKALQRREVGLFSSRLQGPLEPVARESLVQIMYEERSRLESELSSESTGSSARRSDSPPPWVDDKKMNEERLVAMRSYNERVLDRAQAYLTPSQFEQLERQLDSDLRRFGLLIELTDIDETY